MKEKMMNFAKNYGSLVGFFVLEVLAMVGFNLANVDFIFLIVGIVVAISLIPFAIVFRTKEDLLAFGIMSIPLVVLIILSCFSPFAMSAYPLYKNIIFFFGIFAFFFIGFAVKANKGFKIETCLLVIFASMTLLLFISFCYTMYRYEPFYAASYSGKVNFYNGAPYNIGEEAKWLLGFSFEEININYFGLYSAFCTSALAGLLFISPKKQTKLFVLLAVFGGIGLLSIVFIPIFNAMILLIPTIVFVVCYKFLPRKQTLFKILKIMFFILLGLIGLFALVFFLNAQSNSMFNWLHQITKSNKFLNYVFNTNKIAVAIVGKFDQTGVSINGNQGILDISKVGWGGFLFGNSVNNPNISMCGIFLVDIFNEAGFFGFIAYLCFVVFVVLNVKKYLKQSTDNESTKVIIVSCLLTFFVYTSFNDASLPYVHYQNFSNYASIMRRMPTMISLFFVGYIFTSPFRFIKNNVEVTINEK